ncbi:two-component sensor histidine kinase [Streptomyces sp. CB01881]|nr:two-component sensor histidine kinase [Streptomyces sp. CB01881]TYC77859.1 two-component sensor histidine kinase [Streptomyces sp. CB01881]
MLAPVVLAHPGQRAAALLLAATAALAAVVAVLPWPSRRVTLAGAAGLAAIASLALDAGYSGPYRLAAFWLPFEWLALLVLLGRAVRRVPGRWAGPVGALVGLAVLLVPLRFALRVPEGGWTGSLIVTLLSLLPAVGVAGAGLYLRALDARRERAVAGARREQRLEVARGLHDFVAHEITGIVLEAQAGQLPGLNAAETGDLLRRLEEAGLRALDSMDAMVGALRDPQADEAGEGRAAGATRVHGLADLAELVGRFSGTGSTRATVELVPESAGLLSRDAEATAYAVVLEGLTNVRRHAPGAGEVVVRVAVVDGPAGRAGSGGPGGSAGRAGSAGRGDAGGSVVRVVEVSVTDDGGQGRAPGPRGLWRRLPGSGGTGLAGMAERVAAHGGTLGAGPHQRSGWRITCVLPVR